MRALRKSCCTYSLLGARARHTVNKVWKKSWFQNRHARDASGKREVVRPGATLENRFRRYLDKILNFRSSRRFLDATRIDVSDAHSLTS